MAVTKEEILLAIKREAAANGGKPPGMERFHQLTGFKMAQWRGRYWARWSDAVQEAGFHPNEWQGQVGTDDELVRKLADFALELGHVPTAAEQRLRYHQEPGFPSDKTFANRIGNRPELLTRLLDLSLTDEQYGLLHDMVHPLVTASEAPASPEQIAFGVVGSVYLMKSGLHYKIGRSNHVGRRSYEVAIQLPEKLEVIHEIETDDPEGIERYWHQRFASKRANGEWFSLSDEDVRVFKRRRSFM
jgi:hypothetical protein